MLATFRHVLRDETPGLRPKIFWTYSFLILANALLWSVTLLTSRGYPLFLVLAATAYALGLRHAFDADHIAAIDNVTRKLMQEGKRPTTVGLFFSLGHSTVVFVVAVMIGLGANVLRQGISHGGSPLESTAGLIGTSISALFLFAMALINIIILVQVVQAFHSVTRDGSYDEEAVDQMLNQRGFFARIFRGLFKTIDASWKMYPVGLLFGLGFDTATEIGLFVLAGSVGTYHIPSYSAVLLPLMFTAGMTLMDTTDSIMMLGAYGWAFVKPIRKLYYNMVITLISVLVALFIGGIETLGIIQAQLRLAGGFWNGVGALTSINFGWVGVGIVGVFVLSWLISTLIYHASKFDDLEVTRSPEAAATTSATTGMLERNDRGDHSPMRKGKYADGVATLQPEGRAPEPSPDHAAPVDSKGF